MIFNTTILDDWPYINPPTITPFEFEKFDALGWRKWMAKYWPLSLLISAIYLILIFGGRRLMKYREPFELRGPLIAWNLLLASFSLCGFLRTFPELYEVLTGPNGIHRSICIRDNLNPSSIFWAFLFTWSKVFELGDTVFLVLRKKPLTFLHWYHHITVLVFCWATYFHYEPILRWFGVVNMVVHFYMYLYFALKAMRVRLPRSVSITITIFQLSQMVLGVALNCYAIWIKRKGESCARSEEGLNIHLTMYGSYLILFSHYFYKAYLAKASKAKKT